MSEDTRNDASEGEVGADRPEDARRNRTIRFSDFEWEEVRRAALLHDTPPAEFVRETILALARDPGSATSGAVAPSLAPMIERVFRYTWFPATENATRWSAKAAKTNSTRWWPRPARCTNRCAGAPPDETDRAARESTAAHAPAVT